MFFLCSLFNVNFKIIKTSQTIMNYYCRSTVHFWEKKNSDWKDNLISKNFFLISLMNTYFTNIPKNWIQKSLPNLNPFVPKAPFLYPLKTWKNLWVFWFFQGVEKECIGNKWVKQSRRHPELLLYPDVKKNCKGRRYFNQYHKRWFDTQLSGFHKNYNTQYKDG